METAAPNNTVYINNLNEKIKKNEVLILVMTAKVALLEN